jgi:hyperosmotically inducible periplasmic protein
MSKKLALLVSTAGMVLSVACAQSDPGITTAVKSKLAADDTVKAYQINVDTNKRVVTLSGAVETFAAKEQALLLARQTDGVENVVDQLTVNPREAAPAATTGDLTEAANDAERKAGVEPREATDKAKAIVTDPAVTAAVKARLLADTAVSGLKIDVDTKDGTVTLNGTVPTREEANRALFLAHETAGARSVVNNLRIGR